MSESQSRRKVNVDIAPPPPSVPLLSLPQPLQLRRICLNAVESQRYSAFSAAMFTPWRPAEASTCRNKPFGQGLTLVHFSAQPQPVGSWKLSQTTQLSQHIPQNVLTSVRGERRAEEMGGQRRARERGKREKCEER